MPTTIHVWSPKGGQCTTTVACGIAVALDSPVKIHPREGDSDVFALLGHCTPQEGMPWQASLNMASRDDLWDHVHDWGTTRPEPAGDDELVVMALRGPCYLALRKLCGEHAPLEPPHSPTDVIALTTEFGRALDVKDVAGLTGIEAHRIVEIPADPAVARAIDAGIFSLRMPRKFNAPFAKLVQHSGKVYQ